MHQRRNFRLLYLEACLATFTGIAGAFCGAYAVRLGASNTLIGLMNSVPSMLVILVSIPFGRILQRSAHKKWWALGGFSLYRIGYMLFALAPLFTGSILSPAVYFVTLFALVAIPIQFFNIGSVGMMVDIVPEDKRAAVFTTRNILSTLVSTAGVFLAGQWLSRGQFPGNYQALFVVAGGIAFTNLLAWLGMKGERAVNGFENGLNGLGAATHDRRWRDCFAKGARNDRGEGLLHQSAVRNDKGEGLLHQSAVRNDRGEGLLHQSAVRNDKRRGMKGMWGVFAGEAMLARYVVNTLLLNIGLWMAGPLFVVYTVRQLGASDAWIGTSGTVASVCGLVGWMVGRHLVERWGEAATQRRIVTLVGLYPLLVGLFPNLTMILIIGGVYNLLTPSFSLSNYNLWLKIAPAQRREEVTAINNTIMSIGAAIFPLAGVALSNWFGVAPVLIGCGALATLGALAFWAWKIVV